MGRFRKLPWQRNIRAIPPAVASKLGQLADHVAVVPVCTKRISARELQTGVFGHLRMGLNGNQPFFPTTVLPIEDVGPYSLKNCKGWEVKRTDLPKVTKTVYLGDRPIYGDWSNGSFPLWQDRLVYPVDEYAPTDYSIAIDLLQTTGESSMFKFAMNCTLDRDDRDFEEDLLFCLNVLQENTGMCDIDRSSKSREEYIATTLVDWEIFPPGSVDHFLSKAKSALRRADSEADRVIDERVAEFRRLSPERYILGKGGFNRYIGAVLPHNVVVFENIRYGNALYVLYEDWEDVSQRSRTDLLRGNSSDYERIPHAEGWAERFHNAVRQGRQRRRR